jgi:hypothetical protein
MFEKISEEETAFDVCLTVLEKLFLAKIRHGSNDQVRSSLSLLILNK